MSALTTRQKALAAQVVLPLDVLPAAPDACPAWVESRGARCQKPAVEGLLCSRHNHVAERRLTTRIEARAAAEAKAAAERAASEPRLRAELDRLEKKAERLEAKISTPVELAGATGDTHPVLEHRKWKALDRDITAGVELGKVRTRAEQVRKQLGEVAA